MSSYYRLLVKKNIYFISVFGVVVVSLIFFSLFWVFYLVVVPFQLGKKVKKGYV